MVQLRGLGSSVAVILVGCGGQPASQGAATPAAPVGPAGPPAAVAPVTPITPITPIRPPVAAAVTPPVAARRPHAIVSPSGTRDDPYYWLRDDARKDPEVLALLNAENAYTAKVLEPSAATAEALFAEMRGRVKEDDASVPTFDDGYWYYQRFERGKQQPIHARRKAKMTAPEEILLDGNQLAEGHAFYQIGTYAVSRNGALLAWADDAVGRRQYVLHIKNLTTGVVLPDTATNILPDLVWASDNQTLFYTGKDAVTLRQDRVLRHRLGSAHDDLVFQEPDGSYYVGIQLTKSKRYITIDLRATTNSEVRLIDATRPAAPPVVFLARERDHEYQVDHLDGRFWIRTNAAAKNFRVASVVEGKQADRAAWKDVIAHDPSVFVQSFAVFHDFVAAGVRSGGLAKVRVVPAGRRPFFIEADDPTYAMRLVDTPEPNTRRLRYTYDSMVAPTSTFELEVATGAKQLVKQDVVPGFEPAGYTSEYLHATASDGASIPISVVYKKTTPRDGSAPLLIYGYGSYGATTEPTLPLTFVSLLDRGWVFAIAHVRGGQEMGRAWYEAGKLMAKRNTFTDFIAATQYLVDHKLGARDQVFAFGGSAGGLLIGAVANLAPSLYRGLIAAVPFVDVVTTMLDESIPLTTNEFDEWGNPKQQAAYDYILSYSPYDNVRPQAYPSIFVHTGLWDSQVQYFEPAKWVAKLRATKTDGNLLVLDTDMTSGHGGPSGRFDRLKQHARELAFLLQVHDRPDSR